MDKVGNTALPVPFLSWISSEKDSEIFGDCASQIFYLPKMGEPSFLLFHLSIIFSILITTISSLAWPNKAKFLVTKISLQKISGLRLDLHAKYLYIDPNLNSSNFFLLHLMSLPNKITNGPMENRICNSSSIVLRYSCDKLTIVKFNLEHEIETRYCVAYQTALKTWKACLVCSVANLDQIQKFKNLQKFE